METTSDGFLNRRLTIEQPAKGYRIAVDTILLAATVPAQTGERVLDLGCGVGGAMLALRCRVPGLHITGIDIQNELIELCERNIARNNFQDRMNAICGDVAQPLTPGTFDHVVMNPPYHDEARHDVSSDEMKKRANTEKTGELSFWIDAAARALKPSGILTFIHRADRLDELLGLLKKDFGESNILSLLPAADAPPKRVILRAHKGKSAPPAHACNLILHKAGGGYTDEVEAILRDAKALIF